MNTLGRRQLLRYGAIAGLAAPFLEAGSARAQAVQIPRRLVFFVTPNGTGKNWNSFNPAADGTYRPTLAPLEDFKARIRLLRGLDIKSAFVSPIPPDHIPDFLNALTGWQAVAKEGRWVSGGPSIDQHLAKALEGKTRFRSLNLGVRHVAYVSFSGPAQPVAPQVNPWAASQTLFTSLVSPAADLLRLRNERRSILDAVRGDLSALRCQLGTDDRLRLDVHAQALRDLETSWAQNVPVGANCAAPSLGTAVDPGLDANYPVSGQRQMDVIAAALACDLTRVATLQWSWGASNLVHSYAGVTAGHHSISHNLIGTPFPEYQHQVDLIETWYAQQLAYLARKLDAIPEGAGSVLDHTTIVWVHEQADGGGHQRTDMPYVLLGTMGGAIKPGPLLELAGAPHTRLLTTLATAMGVPTESFGDPQFVSSPLTALLA